MIKKPAKKVGKPLIIETITATKEKIEIQAFPKKEILTKVPVPDGHVRCIVLIDYKGMLNDLYAGDVQDLPDRRYKSLTNRGVVKLYDGTRIPNKSR